MDSNYSFPRRLWRIIYPPLVFLAIQVAVVILVTITIEVINGISEVTDGLFMLDHHLVLEFTQNFVTQRSMLTLLVSDIVCLFVFLPIWLHTRKSVPIRKNRRPAALCGLVVVLFASYNLVQMAIFSLTDIIRFFPSYEEVSEAFGMDSFAIRLLTIGVIAPIIEELIFRGILINRMKWMPVWLSVFLQGLLFGVVHLNMFQGLYAFVAGILLGFIYVRYNSIILVIAGHMSYNMISVILSEIENESVVGFIFFLSVILLPVCATRLAKHKKAGAVAPQEFLPPTANMYPDPWNRPYQ